MASLKTTRGQLHLEKLEAKRKKRIEKRFGTPKTSKKNDSKT